MSTLTGFLPVNFNGQWYYDPYSLQQAQNAANNPAAAPAPAPAPAPASASNPTIQLGPNEGGPVAPINQAPITWGTTPAPDPSQYAIDPVNPNTLDSYNMWKNLATSQGPTKFGQQALAQNQTNKNNMLGAIGMQQNSGGQQAKDLLASRGGLSAGAGSRINRNQSNNALLADQGAYGGAKSNMLDILKNDANLKQGALTNLTNADATYAQQSQDAAFRKYQLDMAKWAANVGSTAYKTLNGQ